MFNFPMFPLVTGPECECPPELAELFATYQLLPELRLFVPFSSIDENGDAYDFSEQNHTLTNNNDTPRDVYNDFIPFAELDGVDQSFSIPDEPSISITGSMTIGIMARFDAAGAQRLAGVGNNTLANTAYLLSVSAGDILPFFAVSDGVTLNTIGNNIQIMPGPTWHSIIARYTAGLELAIFVDGVKTVDNTAIIASIQDTAHPFFVGSDFDGGQEFDGGLTQVWVTASALTDKRIAAIVALQMRAFAP